MKSEPHSPYFGGTARDLGHVKRLQARNFRELVEGSIMLAARIGMTRKEFHELEKKDRDSIKRTAYLIPASMKKPDSQRLLVEASSIRLVFLDIDDPREARPYFESPSVLNQALHPFSFALYSTANHTSSSPRLRLVVDADLEVNDYVAAVKTVAAMIGLPSVTTESKVAVQPMYLPVVFQDQDADFDHPLLHYRSDGRTFTVQDLNPDLSDIIGIPKGKRGEDKNDKQASRDFIDALEFLRDPVEGVGLAEAEEILKFLDPDMPYYDWLNVCFALKHQFGGTDDAGFALDLFDEWSSKGNKYAGSKDVRSKWKSARPITEGRSPVTMRSLIRKAAGSGFNAGKLDKHGFLALKDWIEEQEDATKMLNQAIQRIAHSVSISFSEEETLLHVLADHARKLGVKIGLPFLRQQLKHAKRVAKALEKDGEKDAAPAWARGFIHIGATNQFYRQTTGEMLSPDALDNQLGQHLLEKVGPEDDDPSIGTKPVVRPRDYLLNVLKVPTAYDYTYDPRKTFDRIVTQDGRKMVNTYNPTYPEPDHSRAKEAGALLVKHLENLVAEDDYRQVLLDFLTFQVQYPGRKIRWAAVIQGAEGCGKSFLLEVLSAVLGRENVKSIDASVLFSSGFNDWCVGAQVVGLEEIRVVGHNRHEVMNKLKPCITNDRVSVNRKFRDVATMDNVTNYLMFTNHHDSLALTEGTRRYFVLRSAIQTKDQVKDLGEDYFPQLFKMLKKNAAGLRAWFEARKISSGFNPDGHAPRTVYLQEMVEASASDEVTAVRQMIGDSVHPLVSKWIVSTHLMLAMLELEGHKDIKGQRLASILREEGYENIGRKLLGEVRQTLWAKPKLARCKSEVWDFAKDWLSGSIGQEEREVLGF